MRLTAISKDCTDIKKNQRQYFRMDVNADTREEANNLGYDDCAVYMFNDWQVVVDEDKKPIDFSGLLMANGLLEPMFDKVNWDEVFCETKADKISY